MSYLVGTLRARPEPAEYTVQGHPVRISHKGGYSAHDAWIFHEIFVEDLYELPPTTSPPSRVADLGGNIGMFALLASVRWPKAQIIAFEPDPGNAAKYRWMMQRNSIDGLLYEACAGSREGTVSFAGEGSTAHITDDGSGSIIPIVDVFPHLQDVDMVKMDIEGGEWEILADDRFLSIAASTVMMEYHPHLCPSADPRTAAIDALKAAGYTTYPIVHDDNTGVGMLRASR